MINKNILLLTFTICMFASCATPEKKAAETNDPIPSIPEPDRRQRLEAEAIEKLRLSECNFNDPDTSLSGIILRNSASADKVLGTDNKTDERDQYHFYSGKDEQTLTLTQHPGDGKNQLSIFQVAYSDKADHGYKQLHVEAFETEKGIKLGMSRQEVVSRLGKCNVTVDSTKDYINIYYRIETPKDSKTGMLKRNNMPVYYAAYGFRKDVLLDFEFGFEYP